MFCKKGRRAKGLSNPTLLLPPPPCPCQPPCPTLTVVQLWQLPRGRQTQTCSGGLGKLTLTALENLMQQSCNARWVGGEGCNLRTHTHTHMHACLHTAYSGLPLPYSLTSDSCFSTCFSTALGNLNYGLNDVDQMIRAFDTRGRRKLNLQVRCTPLFEWIFIILNIVVLFPSSSSLCLPKTGTQTKQKQTIILTIRIE